MEYANKEPLDRATLVLNRSWTAVNVTTVRRAICLVYSGHARVISPETFKTYDFETWVHNGENGNHFYFKTVTLKIRVPEVILLLTYDSVPAKDVPFSRKNIYKRDNYTCQYCGKKYKAEDLTIDHVVPRSRGGKTTWENCVLACIWCNIKKGDRTLKEAGMRLLRKPSRPKWSTGVILAKENLPSSWKSFISSESMDED